MRGTVPGETGPKGEARAARTVPAPDELASRFALLHRLLRVAALDLTPLRRHRDFRLLYAGRLVSSFGNMITGVAIPYQAYVITRSPLAVGLFGLVQLVPLLTLAFLGGALADSVDRRRLVQLTELALAMSSAALLASALFLPSRIDQLALLYGVAALASGLDALQRPALDALLPRLVERHELTAAGALEELRGTLSSVLGPAAAGLLIATIGLPSTYGVDVATFVVSLAALRLMRAVPPPADANRPSLRRVVEGLRYAKSRPELLGTYLVDFVAMFFGMPSALYPALAVQFASEMGHLPAATVLGFLWAAPAAGAFLAALTSGWSRRVHRHGLAVILAATVWGLAIAAVGLAPSLPVALICLALAGAADAVSGLFRSVIWNTTIPDALRGRLASIELISYSSGPLLGDVEAGAVASAFSPRVSVFSGGVLCVAGVGLLALALPQFRRYDARRAASDAAEAALSHATNAS